VIPFQGYDSRLAYRFDPTRRDWLDEPEAHALRALLEIYWRDRDELPDRLGQALRAGEDAVRQHYLERSLPLIVTGLEALINTSKTEVTKQFAVRVPALAIELGVAGVSRSLAQRLYRARSESSHGQRIALFEPWSPAPARRRRALDRSEDQRRVLGQVGLLQQVLRAAVRRGIEDLDFRAAIATPTATRARWPVPASDGSGLL
jgi:hypothetical protein